MQRSRRHRQVRQGQEGGVHKLEEPIYASKAFHLVIPSPRSRPRKPLQPVLHRRREQGGRALTSSRAKPISQMLEMAPSSAPPDSSPEAAAV